MWVRKITLGLFACSAQAAKVQPPSASPAPLQSMALADVKLGVPVTVLASDSSLFVFDEHGHFGSKTQYNSVKRDADGGTYVAHCRDGSCFGVEIKYDAAGLDRKRALAVAERVAGQQVSGMQEHDDEDLKASDSQKGAGEFFYSRTGVRIELRYAPRSISNVAQVNVWSN